LPIGVLGLEKKVKKSLSKWKNNWVKACASQELFVCLFCNERDKDDIDNGSDGYW
jgi:hypothetical protein